MVAGAIAGNLDLTTSRRLNLAAAAHATPLVLLRTPIAAGTSAAATRWRIAAAPAARDRFGAFAGPRWRVALERCRNGRPGHWLIEWNHVAHCFRLVEGVADRAPAATRRPPSRRLTPSSTCAGRSSSSRRARAARASSPSIARRGRAASWRASCSPMPAPRCSTCSRATPILPPTRQPCASWRSGACATRRSWRHGTRQAAPTACSSTSRGARISSAARRGCWPISSGACAHSGFTRALAIAGTAGASWAMARHGPADARIVASGEEAKALADSFARRAQALGRDAGAHAPARLQAHRRAHRSAARAVCRALRAGIPAPPRPGIGARARAARRPSCRRPSIARRRCSSSRS